MKNSESLLLPSWMCNEVNADSWPKLTSNEHIHKVHTSGLGRVPSSEWIPREDRGWYDGDRTALSLKQNLALCPVPPRDSDQIRVLHGSRVPLDMAEGKENNFQWRLFGQCYWEVRRTR